MAGWSGPGATAGRSPGVDPGQRAGRFGARAARDTPAEGIGLFRTELCFLNTDTEPTVEEQASIYGEVLDAFADARSSYAPGRRIRQAAEVRRPSRRGQPRAGVRGIRIEALHPEVLERQLDAIALAAEQTGSARG